MLRPTPLIPLLLVLVTPFAAGQTEGVPVVVDGQTVLRIRADLGGYNAERRARDIEARIVSLAESHPEETLAIELREESGLLIIRLGGRNVMAVSEADARAEGLPQRQLAQAHAERIREAVLNYRRLHSWTSIALGVLKAFAAWALFVLAVFGIKRASDWLRAHVEQWFSQAAMRRGARGLILTIWERLTLLALMLLRVVVAVFLLVQFSVLLTYTFSLFPATQGISVSVLDSLLRALGQVTEAVIDYMPRGLFVAVVLFLAYYAEQLMRVAFLALERGDLVLAKIPPDMARITFQLSRAALIIFVLVIIFPYLPGGQSDAFKGVSIFLGVLLSLGSSSAISNILAGVVLTYMRPYKIGDFVKIADQVGNVLEKGLLVTRLRTNKNVEVTIPNSAILGTQILNYSAMAKGQGLILHSTVTIGYDVPWRQVHELLIEAALATEGVLPEPRPFVLQTALNDFHISYEINAHTNRPNEMMRVYSALHANIQESFNRAGVEIMSPTFLALRDGNTVTIPPAHLPQDYQPPAFRFKQQG